VYQCANNNAYARLVTPIYCGNNHPSKSRPKINESEKSKTASNDSFETTAIYYIPTHLLLVGCLKVRIKTVLHNFLLGKNQNRPSQLLAWHHWQLKS
jgi:hypothetical protein